MRKNTGADFTNNELNNCSIDDVGTWRRIYRLLNEVSVLPEDCGTLCNHACCSTGGEEMGIYLFPGEHLIFKEQDVDKGWLEWEKQDAVRIGFSRSWKQPVYFAKCKTPPVCPRKWRPFQCRTFPLKPVFGDSGALELIWDDGDLPYSCPIIEQKMPIQDDFYRATYKVWSFLARDKRIFDLIMSWS
ncbi:MAG: hypothetical protein ACOX75_01925 [Lachnospiraceae bacterium]|jgi:hypothetical protein